MNVTGIEWTTFSANPLKYRDEAGNIVWGCVHASPGCQHCYSEALAKRYGRGGPFNVQTMVGLTPFLDEAECRKMRTAKQIGGVAVAGSRCFIGDMTDIFGEWVSDDLLNQLFSNVLEIRTDVTWQLLTKRAERMHRYLSWRWGEGRIPSRHIHIGVSVENQHFADERIQLLLQTPAAVRFISAEPLLGPVNVCSVPSTSGHLRVNALNGGWDVPRNVPGEHRQEPRLHWVIVGLESGPGARPGNIAWVSSIVEQCQAARVACFVKQLGAVPVMDEATWRACEPTPLLSATNGRRAPAGTVPLKFYASKAKNPDEWPLELRIREFPPVSA